MTFSPKALLLAPLLMLAGCAAMTGQQTPSTPTLTRPSTATRMGTIATDPLCSEFRIVDLSRYDTTGTKNAVSANNAVWTRVCGK